MKPLVFLNMLKILIFAGCLGRREFSYVCELIHPIGDCGGTLLVLLTLTSFGTPGFGVKSHQYFHSLRSENIVRFLPGLACRNAT